MDVELDYNLNQLFVNNIEEFVHALTHVKPMMVVIEINDREDAFYKLMRIIKKSVLTKGVPLLVLANTDDDDFIDVLARENIEAILYKPIKKSVIDLYIRNFSKMMQVQNDLQLIQDLKTVQTVMISGLASLAEYRDPETGEHIKRTQNYVKALAVTLMRKGHYKDQLSMEKIESMYMSVPLHDIGKVGISDQILLKPERLTAEEFQIMKTHAKIGYDTIVSVGNKLKNNAFLEYAADVAYTHHERFDGTGYPRGLKGQEIPLIGRLMAVADVYDALTSKRVYKDAMSHEEAVAIIQAESGKHFDPIIVNCMMTLESTFRNIVQTYRDYDQGSKDKYKFLKDLVVSQDLNRVLVVEDSRIVREITRNQLEALGVLVEVASDGVDGYDKAKTGDYDLVLLDIEMPRMNGYTMAKKIRDLGKDCVLIAMTAADYSVTLEELRAYGIEGMVLKPIDFNRIAGIYKEALRSQSS